METNYVIPQEITVPIKLCQDNEVQIGLNCYPVDWFWYGGFGILILAMILSKKRPKV